MPSPYNLTDEEFLDDMRDRRSSPIIAELLRRFQRRIEETTVVTKCSCPICEAELRVTFDSGDNEHVVEAINV